MSDFGNASIVKARKEHQCQWCYGPILKGERHNLWKGHYDGSWQQNRMHIECEEVASDGEAGIYDYTPGSGEMPDRVREIVESRKAAKLEANSGRNVLAV